jgi:iron complex transport system permease protein
VLASLGVGAAVATCGVIGFVGLVVPYLVRGALGPGHRALLPASALGGAILLVIADLVARTIVGPAELPVGVVTALVGAPVLLALVRRGRGREVMP